MYIKRQNDREPYQIIITEKEMKAAFRNLVTYELFRQTLISQIMNIYFQSITCRMVDDYRNNDIVHNSTTFKEADNDNSNNNP